MESQIVSAINIAADPHQDRALKSQAVDFLNAVRVNAKASCTVALTLFLDQNPDGSRKHNHQVRVFALQLLDDFLDARCALVIVTIDEFARLRPCNW